MPNSFNKSLALKRGSVAKRLVQRVFVNDWQLKLVAAIVTFALWMGVTGLKTPTTARLKGVALILNVQNDTEVMSAPVEFVDLVVTGDKRKVDLLNPRDLVASLDLSAVEPGERTVQITTSNVSVELPTGVRLESIEPGIVPITLERVLEREVPVKVETTGSLATGLEVYTAVSDPSTVKVRGPESVVRQLEFVSTEKVSIRNRQDDFSVGTIGLQAVNPKARFENTVVSVRVVIGAKRTERQLSVPVTVDGRRRTAVLTVYAPTEVFSELNAEDLKVTVEKTPSGDSSIEVTIPSRFRDSVEVTKKALK